MKKVLGMATFILLSTAGLQANSAKDSGLGMFVEVFMKYGFLSNDKIQQGFDFSNQFKQAGASDVDAELTHHMSIESMDNKVRCPNAIEAGVAFAIKQSINDKLSLGAKASVASTFHTTKHDLTKLSFSGVNSESKEVGFADVVSTKVKDNANFTFKSSSESTYATLNGKNIELRESEEEGEEDILEGTLEQTPSVVVNGANAQKITDVHFSDYIRSKLPVGADADKKTIGEKIAGKDVSTPTALAALMDGGDLNVNNNASVYNPATLNTAKLALGLNSGNLTYGKQNTGGTARDSLDDVTNRTAFSAGDLTVVGRNPAASGAGSGAKMQVLLATEAANTAADFITFANSDAVKDGKITDVVKFFNTFFPNADALKAIVGIKAKDFSLNKKGVNGIMDAKFVDFNQLFDVAEQGVKLTERDLLSLGITDKSDHYLVFGTENDAVVSKVMKGSNGALVGKDVTLASFGTGAAVNKVSYDSEQTVEITDLKKKRIFSTSLSGVVEYKMTPHWSIELALGGLYAYNQTNYQLKFKQSAKVNAEKLEGSAVQLGKYTMDDATAESYNFSLDLADAEFAPSSSAVDTFTLTNASGKDRGDVSMKAYNHAFGGKGELTLGFTPEQSAVKYMIGISADVLANCKNKFKDKKEGDVDYGFKGVSAQQKAQKNIEFALHAVLGVEVKI